MNILEGWKCLHSEGGAWDRTCTITVMMQLLPEAGVVPKLLVAAKSGSGSDAGDVEGRYAAIRQGAFCGVEGISSDSEALAG